MREKELLLEVQIQLMIICFMIKITIIGCITPKLQMGIKICILLHQFSLLALHLLVNGVLVMEVWILEEVMEILEEVEILVETMEVVEIVEVATMPS